MKSHGRDDILLGNGDDAAVIKPPDDAAIVVSMDTLVSGVHFPENTSASDVAFKSIMVNLSDMAAMGAQPSCLLLSLTLPDSNESWLIDFANQFNQLCNEYDLELIGGDTTHGPLSITVQVFGYANSETVFKRSNAQAGDLICVTGFLGDAATGLRLLNDKTREESESFDYFIARLNRPVARVEFSNAICEYTCCAIDVSDGLLADLGHICDQSNVGAQLRLEDIPVSDVLKNFSAEINWDDVLCAGDDYELCFTIKPESLEFVKATAKDMELNVSVVGEITASKNIEVYDQSGRQITFGHAGFQHF